jgi:hypothetical protein
MKPMIIPPHSDCHDEFSRVQLKNKYEFDDDELTTKQKTITPHQSCVYSPGSPLINFLYSAMNDNLTIHSDNKNMTLHA